MTNTNDSALTPFMLIGRIVLVFAATLCMGLAIAFLWVQTGLPAKIPGSSWDAQIYLFPSIYVLWLPLIYLFFSGLWLYLFQKYQDEDIQLFGMLDTYSYFVVLGFFLLQTIWRTLGSPGVWFRGIVLGILLWKSLLLFRALYSFPQGLHSILLLVIGTGIHLLLIPFRYQALSLSFVDLLNRAEVIQLAVLTVKALCLNVMTLEMFRLGMSMTESKQSAFFSWLVVTLTFPILGFPKISYILVGLLLVFILRMIFSRLDTHELMVGLLTPTNVIILVKLVIVLALLIAAGGIFWSNVRPGFEFRGTRAFLAAIGTLFDAQFGILGYAPVYWLAFFGMVYLLVFKIWDGILLVITGSVIYMGYHWVVYGILGRVVEQSDSVPLLPIFGVFIAIAHARFGKLVGFRYGMRLAAIATVGITSMLLLFFPDFPSIPVKIAELQQVFTALLGRDFTYIFPSFIFNPFPVSFFLWIGILGAGALIFCNSRTQSAQVMAKTLRRIFGYLHVGEFSFAPGVLLLILGLGVLAFSSANPRQKLPLEQPLRLSKITTKEQILLDPPVLSRSIVVVSSVTGGIAIPHKTPVADVVVFGKDKHFESFTLRVGKDTSEENLDQPDIKVGIAHGRAAIYRSWNVIHQEEGVAFPAHDYYTKFVLSKPFEVHKIVVQFIDPAPGDTMSMMEIHIKDMIVTKR